jgi:hypothetical protein
LFVIQKICSGSGEETQSAASVKKPDFNGLLPAKSAFCGHDANSQLQISVPKFDTRLSVAEGHSGILAHSFYAAPFYSVSALIGPVLFCSKHSTFRLSFSAYSYDFFIQSSSGFLC